MPDITNPQSEQRGAFSRRGVLARILMSVTFGLLFGGVIAVLNRQAFAHTLVYALAISLLCWACIDGGRSGDRPPA